MPLHAVFSLISQLCGCTARTACAALLLVAALHTHSSASTQAPSGDETVIPAAVLTFFPAGADDIAGGESSAYATVTDYRKPDWKGIRDDTGILFGAQFVAVGVLYLMPESISSWSGDQKHNSFKKYGNNFVNPVIDKDKFYINYLIHPYWGSTYYTRGRERGLNKASAFVYSTLISSLFEFGVECFYEKPSIQDLIVTPVAGSLLGAYLFEPWRESIKNKQEMQWYDHAVLIATDPVGLLSLGFEKLFGLKPTIMIDYPVPKTQIGAAESTGTPNSGRIGIVLKFPLN